MRMALRAAMAITAEYLPTAGTQRNPSDYTPELSRRARGVDIWAALETLGRSGVAAMIERCCAHATRFAAGLTAGRFEVLNEVVLNQVLVSFGSAGAHAAGDRSRAARRHLLGWQHGVAVGRTAMRISVSSWATTAEDVEKSLAAMIPRGARLKLQLASGCARRGPSQWFAPPTLRL